MNDRRGLVGARMVRRLRGYFLAGLVLVVPLAATILILRWVFISIDGIVGPLVKIVFGHPVPGIGFAATIVTILLVGFAASHIVGRTVIGFGEALLLRVPIAKHIYNTFKQALQGLALNHEDGFKEVVLVEFPRPGMKTIGFITNHVRDSTGQELLNVYIPTAPNPTSGFLEIIPANEVAYLSITVEEAMKMVISGGMVSPDILKTRSE